MQSRNVILQKQDFSLVINKYFHLKNKNMHKSRISFINHKQSSSNHIRIINITFYQLYNLNIIYNSMFQFNRSKTSLIKLNHDVKINSKYLKHKTHCLDSFSLYVREDL